MCIVLFCARYYCLYAYQLSYTTPHAAVVENVRVMELNSSLVMVSWDPISGVPWLTNYMVYYSWTAGRNQSNEFSVNVSSSDTSVVIGDLRTDVLYQFQVVGIAERNRKTFLSDRSTVNNDSRIFLQLPLPGGTCVDQTM